jgi:hypothetical protein
MTIGAMKVKGIIRGKCGGEQRSKNGTLGNTSGLENQ